MKTSKRIFLTMIVTLAVMALSACDEQVTRQMIPDKEFREWFLSRLIVTIVAAILLGVIVSLIVRQFRVKPGATHTNRQARTVFAMFLALISLAVPAALWFEAYLRVPFSIRSISLSNYFLLLIPSYFTWAIVGAAFVVFYLVVMLLTRFVGGRCNCQFAFLPGFKRSKRSSGGRT